MIRYDHLPARKTASGLGRVAGVRGTGLSPCPQARSQAQHIYIYGAVERFSIIFSCREVNHVY